MNDHPVERFGAVNQTTPTTGHILSSLLSKWELQLFPSLWADSAVNLGAGLTWKTIKFCPKNVEKDIKTITTAPGIYQFIVKGRQDILDDHSYIFYIGKAEKGLRQRYREYVLESKGESPSEDREKITRMLIYFRDNLYFKYTEIDKKKCAELESALKDNFTSPANSILKLKGRLY